MFSIGYSYSDRNKIYEQNLITYYSNARVSEETFHVRSFPGRPRFHSASYRPKDLMANESPGCRLRCDPVSPDPFGPASDNGYVGFGACVSVETCLCCLRLRSDQPLCAT